MPPSQMFDMLSVLFQEQHNVTFPFYFQYSSPHQGAGGCFIVLTIPTIFALHVLSHLI